MRSRISLFDKTLFRKDLSRFAPLWALYTLCLFVGMSLMYFSQGKQFWYASRLMNVLCNIMPVVNLCYGGLTALLLFGDLYDSRMCNAVHALPLRRETIFGTHIAAGLCYSLGPTLLFSLGSIPLLMGTCVANGWALAPLWFLGANLQYILFFGIAVLCALCAGSRVVMLMLYGIVNVFSLVLYFAIDAFYTPMLYGVVTPEAIGWDLCPAVQASKYLVEFESYNELMVQFRGRTQDMVAHYTFLPQSLGHLALCALVGVVLGGIALALYRKRDLERAGDALGVPALEPLAPILGALGAATVAYTGLGMFDLESNQALAYPLLVLALAVGWFAGKMLLSRSTRVFYPKNLVGLAVLMGCLALSLAATYFDVLNIDDRIPEAGKVEKVFVYSGNFNEEYTDLQDIETILTIQRDILGERLQWEGGVYFPHIDDFEYNRTYTPEAFQERFDQPGEHTITPEELQAAKDALTWYPYRKATSVQVEYTLKNGRVMERSYYLWTDSEAGSLLCGLANRWDSIYESRFYPRNEGDETLDLDNIAYFYVGYGNKSKDMPKTRELAESLLAALEADAQAGHMAQNRNLHNGFFSTLPNLVESDFYIQLETKTGSLHISFYADSQNTIDWFRDQGFTDFLATQENIYPLDAALAQREQG